MVTLSDEKPDIVEVLFAKRKFVLAILSVPVLGMAIAAALILYTKPDNIAVALGVILFVAVQYILMMYFWYGRLERLITNRKEEETLIEETPIEVEVISAEGAVLATEEERIFPIKDE